MKVATIMKQQEKAAKMLISLNVRRQSECLEVGERRRNFLFLLQCEKVYETAGQPVQRLRIGLASDARQKADQYSSATSSQFTKIKQSLPEHCQLQMVALI